MIIHNLPKLSSELKLLNFKVKEEKTYVDFFSDKVVAGFPSPATDFKDERLSLDERYLDDPDSTYIIKVDGNSMYPTLMAGDILVVKSNMKLTDKAVGIVSVNNTEFTVKRLCTQTNQLIADNVDFPNIQINDDDIVQCLGVIKVFIREDI